jgi:hypothetical protein
VGLGGAAGGTAVGAAHEAIRPQMSTAVRRDPSGLRASCNEIAPDG